MNYDFPVSLEDIYLKDGTQIPKMKAVVNNDTARAVSTVSNVYQLVRHKTVMDEALKYVEKLGTPNIKFHVSPTGAKAVGEFTYVDKTIAVRKGDLVGLRCYVENSYNATSKVKFRIGGMVLKCMNGMMMPHDVFSIAVAHKGEPVFEFPTVDTVMGHFEKSAEQLSKFAKYELSPPEYLQHAEQAVEDGIIAERVLAKLSDEGNSAWDLYNDFTHDITHGESSRATYIGKLSRLNRVAAWMDNTFGVMQ